MGWALDAEGNPTDDPDKYDDRESQGNYFMKVDPFEPELNEYLRLDCVALYEIVTMLIDISGLPIHEFLKCPTTASLAMKVYQMNYPDDYEKLFPQITVIANGESLQRILYARLIMADVQKYFKAS